MGGVLGLIWEVLPRRRIFMRAQVTVANVGYNSVNIKLLETFRKELPYVFIESSKFNRKKLFVLLGILKSLQQNVRESNALHA